MTPIQILAIQMVTDAIIRRLTRRIQAISEMSDEEAQEIIDQEEQRTAELMARIK